MNQQLPPEPTQRFNIDNASIQDSQFGQAGHDLTQIQGEIIYVTVGDKVTVPEQFGRQVHSVVKPFSRQEDLNRKVLINKVKKICIEVLENSLHIHPLIELGLEKRLDIVQQSFSEVQGIYEYNKRALPSDVGITAVFNQMGEGGTLLILGEPGSGKTITLVRLTLDLISRAEEDYTRKIPVVLNLSSWASERQTIADWIVQRLNISYGVSRPLGKAWVEEQQLLLLLDGLDEVRAECREACVQAINKFLQKYGTTEIVVCSRVREYEALSTYLKLQQAICIQPLTPEQIKQYFQKAGDQLVSVKTLIDVDATLQELAKSPLMLNIMTLVYKGVSVTDLLSLGSIEERRKDLFDKYIEQMFKRRDANQQYSREQVMHWLIWLAKKMSQFSQTIFLIEGMQAAWLQTTTQQLAYRISIRLIPLMIWGSLHIGLLSAHKLYMAAQPLNEVIRGLTYGLLGGMVGAMVYGLFGEILFSRLSQRLHSRLINGLLLALIYGPIFGIIFIWNNAINWGLFYGLIYSAIGVIIYEPITKDIEPVDAITWSWQKAKNHMIFGLVIALILVLARLAYPVHGPIFGLTITLILGLDKKIEVDSRTSPNQGIWRSVNNAKTLFVTIGILVGLLIGATQGGDILNRLIAGLVNGLFFGMAGALIGGQGSGIACIKHFTLRCVLWLNGHIPWNYSHFLDYASKRIFLQKVGGGYIFFHRMLQEHFAQIEADQVGR